MTLLPFEEHTQTSIPVVGNRGFGLHDVILHSSDFLYHEILDCLNIYMSKHLESPEGSKKVVLIVCEVTIDLNYPFNQYAVTTIAHSLTRKAISLPMSFLALSKFSFCQKGFLNHLTCFGSLDFTETPWMFSVLANDLCLSIVDIYRFYGQARLLPHLQEALVL